MEAHLVQNTLSLLGRNALLAAACAAETTSPGLVQSVRDNTLIGLVRKGHGLEALCFFLGLLQVDLLARLCALDLTVPHNGSVRRRNGRRNAWQIGEIRQLIALWEQNFSSASIASKLGRSSSSIRSKARWLGLWRRRNCDIITDVAPVPALVTDATNGVPTPVTEATNEVAAAVIDAANEVPAVVQKRTRWVNELYLLVIERFLGYQHYKGIARDLSLTPAQVRSKIQALGLPSDRERHLQSMTYQPDTPHAIALRGRFIHQECPETGQVYVTPRKNRRRYCPAYYKSEQYRHRAAFGCENYSVSHMC